MYSVVYDLKKQTKELSFTDSPQTKCADFNEIMSLILQSQLLLPPRLL